MVFDCFSSIASAREVRIQVKALAEISPDIGQIKRIDTRLCNEVSSLTDGIDFAVILDAFLTVKTALCEQLADFIPFPKRAGVSY